MNASRTDNRLMVGAALVVGLVVIVVGIGTCGGVDTSNPEATVESYFSAVADGNGEDACSVLTEDFQQAAVATVVGTPSEADTCEEAIENVPDDAKELVEDVDIKADDDPDGDTTTVAVTINHDDAPAGDLLFPLVRDGDEWLIEGPPQPESG